MISDNVTDSEYFMGRINIRPNIELFNAKLALKVSGFLESGDQELDFLCPNAKSALLLILIKLKLKKDDLVSIITSSQGSYISSCVTNTVEKICHWNREICLDTKAVVVVNEFGFLADIEKINQEFSGPIIEDNAYCFPALLDSKRAKFKDFSIYSLPKFFGGEAGGLCIEDNLISQSQRLELKATFSKTVKSITNKRSECHSKYRDICERFRFDEFEFSLENMCRSVFFLNLNSLPMEKIYALKEKVQNEGIECTIFYPLPLFILPCNSTIGDNEISEIFFTIDRFLNS